MVNLRKLVIFLFDTGNLNIAEYIYKVSQKVKFLKLLEPVGAFFRTLYKFRLPKMYYCTYWDSDRSKSSCIREAISFPYCKLQTGWGLEARIRRLYFGNNLHNTVFTSVSHLSRNTHPRNGWDNANHSLASGLYLWITEPEKYKEYKRT